MATTALLGAGTLLQRGDGASPEVFTTVYEGTSISDFGQENDLVEVTHFQSTAKEYIYGLSDGVEVPLSANYNPSNATHVGLLADQTNKVTRNFKLRLTSSPFLTFSFAALVKGWRLSFGPNNAVVMNWTLKISGAITGPV
jgi:hypothetical protein